MTNTEVAAITPAAVDKTGAAAYLACGTRKLEEYVAAGQIKPLRHGRKLIFRLIDLDAFLDRLVTRE